MALWDFRKSCLMMLFCAILCTYCGLARGNDNKLVGDLLLANATIVDPKIGVEYTGHLLIKKGLIIGVYNKLPQSHEGQIVDLKGKWIMPGLVDMHVHSYGNQGPKNLVEHMGAERVADRVLKAGVTAFVDLFSHEDTIYRARQRQRSGEFEGADIFASLSCMTATKGHCTEYGISTREINTPLQARQEVTDLMLKEPDVVKFVYNPQSKKFVSMDKETLRAATETAKKYGVKTIVHINSWQGVQDAVDVGVSAVTHLPYGPAPVGIADQMRKKGVAVIPTLAVETEFYDFYYDNSVLEAPLAKLMTTEAMLSAYKDPVIRDEYRDSIDRSLAASKEELEFVKMFSEAGVTILAGSDAGNPKTLHGYSMHRELIKMVKAGLTPWQALAAATTEAGEFLGKQYGVGVGDEANLVVLHASPISDIANTQRIDRVIHHGKLVYTSTIPDEVTRKQPDFGFYWPGIPRVLADEYR